MKNCFLAHQKLNILLRTLAAFPETHVYPFSLLCFVAQNKAFCCSRRRQFIAHKQRACSLIYLLTSLKSAQKRQLFHAPVHYFKIHPGRHFYCALPFRFYHRKSLQDIEKSPLSLPVTMITGSDAPEQKLSRSH